MKQSYKQWALAGLLGLLMIAMPAGWATAGGVL
jgi:hypothetical protein